jgi:16S rRNA (cytidine1402-2'-O)-methyltransferase
MIDSAAGKLSVVSTPIGNLADLSPRAADCLRDADIVACEDTRHSGVLLKAHDINTPRVSLHQHNEAARTAQFLEKLAAGSHIAYISDAGTPLVSDPGARLVHLVAEAGHQVEVIPGPSAVTAALAGSGFPADRFYFGGFLSTKKVARGRELTEALERKVTSVFFDSPHRILSTLAMIAEMAPDRPLVIARELTKKFEEFRRGSSTELVASFIERPPKGEFVLILSGSKPPGWMRS